MTRRAGRRPRAARVPGGMAASVEQTCPLCLGLIRVGDLIARTRRGYAHTRCIQQEHE